MSRKPLSLIHPMFLLDIKIGDPTRIPLEHVKLYWKAWVSLEAKGYPFSFLSIVEGEEEEEEIQPKSNRPSTSQLAPPQVFDFDDGVPLPCECDTSALRTTCLLQLVSKSGGFGKAFHVLVKQVDALQVSLVLIIHFYYILYHFRIQISQVGFRMPSGHLSNGHGIVSTWLRKLMKILAPSIVFWNG